jgi:phage nucleotide-binding protein
MQTIDLGKLKKEEQPIHCIIYGEAGCGKTHLLRDFPKPMLVMDFDAKYEPLLGVDGIFVKGYYMDKADDAKVIIPQFWRDWREAKADPQWRTIAIDSVTALDRILERYTVAMSGKGKESGERATIQEYGDMKRWYSTFFPSLRSAVGKNVVVLAHEQSKEDDGVLVSIRPYITGKMGDVLASIFQHTFHMEHITGSQERRVLHYKKHKKYVCSSSILSEGSGVIDNPTYEKLLEVMKGNTNGK